MLQSCLNFFRILDIYSPLPAGGSEPQAPIVLSHLHKIRIHEEMWLTGKQVEHVKYARYDQFYARWQVKGAVVRPWDAAISSLLHTHLSFIRSRSASESNGAILTTESRRSCELSPPAVTEGLCLPADGSLQARTPVSAEALGRSSCHAASLSEAPALTHTGNGSAPSWMTKPSMTCVRTWGLTMAWGGLFSPFCGALPVTVGASLSFPEVMAGGGVPGAAICFLVEPPPVPEIHTPPSS